MTPKVCPRCKDELSCSSQNILACECTSIKLSENTNEFLRKTNYDCLCNSCLVDLNNKTAYISALGLSEELIENRDFYYENGFVVFTELYHMIKGKCCKSNCRHCAYGFKLR